MLGSMYSAVSGLSAHQTKMNVIGNNIANVNTYGFKASRVTFSDVFYQTMNGASAPTTNGGGTNPTQLGYGAKVNSIDVLNTRAGSATTDRALDVYINGDGYLPVKNSDGVIKYTRVGVLSFDVAGNLVDSNGNMVLGFKLDDTTKNAQLNSDGTTSAQNLVPIKVDPKELDKYTGIAIGQNGEITAIKEGDTTVVPGSNTGWMNGTPTVSANSNYSGSITMSVKQTFAADNANYTGDTPITVSSNAYIGAANMSVTSDGTTYTLSYTDKDGNSQSATGTINTSTTPNTVTFTGVMDAKGGTSATVTIPVDQSATPSTAVGYNIPTDGSTYMTLGNVTVDSYDITFKTTDKAGTTVTNTTPETWVFDATTPDNNLAFGDIGFTIDSDKFKAVLDGGFSADTVIGRVGPGAGVPEKIANIAVVKFTNPDGLSQDGEGYFVATTNSGDPVATIPGNGGTGTFRSGALEMSNVDLSREFTEMIITQRGFQANTRMITVSDEMLSELVSMKR
ncbi:flagellar hook-basal body complex protein [Sinanaerobacter chloroacetimidivorans]|jgi:flagellar hook protein FlgE|uniref:Flagellar hook protein FlgE n=1 Tax=Sinanaerobacter chloroacetimidivorans TaxID=2818044 RepID=A0A8J8B1D1_9FIRM|nr:flagellar hook-basal body complex protein [Sinanaerobacter chloroacetimidivorans]MBR0597536.1 flagellar hook-basal body complex protein [Sinanaerobacter chloroacetimidivorans]